METETCPERPEKRGIPGLVHVAWRVIQYASAVPDEWTDGLRFCVLFSSISVESS